MKTDDALPGWAVEAARLPVAFAQVREDALLDLRLLDRIGGSDIRGIMIASGGCTAAALVSSGRLSHLHLVDANPAQIALTRIKLHLLQTTSPLERARILGHAAAGAPRAPALTELFQTLGLPADALGPMARVAELGPDHAGRYEVLFAQLRAQMREFADEWTHVLNLPDAGARIEQTNPGTPLGRAMDSAFDRAMALPILVRLFGAQATQNSVMPFSQHFAARTRLAIATLPTADNPYLWQLLVGRFPNAVRYPWMEAAAPARMPDIVTSVAAFDRVLGQFRDSFDFVHLSNILDWLSPDEAQRVLDRAWNALRPGGYAWIRQLNSTLRLRELCPAFEWLDQESEELHARDRSFFYRQLHLGRKR